MNKSGNHRPCKRQWRPFSSTNAIIGYLGVFPDPSTLVKDFNYEETSCGRWSSLAPTVEEKTWVYDHQYFLSLPFSSPDSTYRILDKAIANFFKPASEKEPDKTRWRVLHDTLLVGNYSPAEGGSRASKRRKIAAFDFVGSLSLWGQ